MASYTVAIGDVGAHAKTLEPSTVDTVTFQTGSPGTPGWGNTPKAVEILTDGASDMYGTTDGTAPTVAGSHCFRVPAAGGSTIVSVDGAQSGQAVVVKLISDGTPTYSVSRA